MGGQRVANAIAVDFGARHHGGLGRVYRAGHDGLQGQDDLGRDDQGVNGQVWAGRVAAPAGDADDEVVFASVVSQK